MREWFFSGYTLFIVLIGSGLIGMTTGVLGTFSFLRKECLLGDAIAHATLPGVVIAFLLTHSKEAYVLATGAFFFAWIALGVMETIANRTTLSKDASLGIILSVFFGLGTFLISIIQHTNIPNQAGLHKFLFGNASTLLKKDLVMIAMVSSLCLAGIMLFWKEIKSTTFDADFAKSMGMPTRKIHFFLTNLFVLAIIAGIQCFGVILMSALFAIPATAARFWVHRLEKMAILSGLFGALSGVTGAIWSGQVDHLPTGPIIVVVMGSLVFFSLLFARKKRPFFHRIKQVSTLPLSLWRAGIKKAAPQNRI